MQSLCTHPVGALIAVHRAARSIGVRRPDNATTNIWSLLRWSEHPSGWDPGGVESQHRARRHTDAIVRAYAEQKRAR